MKLFFGKVRQCCENFSHKVYFVRRFLESAFQSLFDHSRQSLLEFLNISNVLNVSIWIFNWASLIDIQCLKFQKQSSREVVKRCSVQKVFLKISENSQENTCSRVSFLIKLQGDSGTGVLLRILRNFYEHLFLQNASSGCFWSLFLITQKKYCMWIQT